MTRFLLICLGGAVGSGARYLVALWAARALPAHFPYGTLLVNVVGSLLLGALMHAGISAKVLPTTVLLTLTTGVMGGFTTYSTFNWETLQYFQRGHTTTALLYVAVTWTSCLLGGWLGMTAARALWPAA